MDSRNLVYRGFEILGENLRELINRDSSDTEANRKTGMRFAAAAAAFISVSVYSGYFNDDFNPAQVTEQDQLDDNAN